MQATGNYNLSNGGLLGSDTQTYPTHDPVSVLDFPANGSDDGGYHSYGSTSGNFGSRASGEGVYDISSGFTITQTVTNTSTVVESATFNFNITPGILSNTLTSFLPGEFVKSGINFNIQSNNVPVWDSAAQLLSDSTGTSFTNSGHNLYTLLTPTLYGVNGGHHSVSLGTLNPGQSLTLTYDISTFAQGNAPGHGPITLPASTITVPGQWVVGCGNKGVAGCNDNGATPTYVPAHTITIPSTVYAGKGGSQGSSGDPFDIDTQGHPVVVGTADPLQGLSSVTLSPVPEPTSAALAVAGLGVLAAFFSATQRGRRI